MEPFVKHRGKFITLDRANTDTDAIIPARYLKKIERVGYGELLFMDLKQKDGVPVPEFTTNRPEAEGASVLVARQNFGCGSSREHAVWAISQAGFRAVVAPRVGATPGFADIFRNNSYKNGLLPVEVTPEFAERLFQAGTGEITIDLETRTVTAHLPGGDVTESFAVPDGSREMLLQGLDEIGLTLQHAGAIGSYEQAHPEVAPAAA
ncbi:MAG: 3-isopropylmalate dehydratase small subunit [Armatimonadota bacterium]